MQIPDGDQTLCSGMVGRSRRQGLLTADVAPISYAGVDEGVEKSTKLATGCILATLSDEQIKF
jgi:hypothetical protein